MSKKRAAARDQPLAHLSQPFTGNSRGSSFHKAPLHEGDKKVGSSIFLGFNLDFFPQNIILAQALLHPRSTAASGTPEEHFS